MTERDCGNYSKKQELSFAFNEYLSANGSTAHMTIVFNVFVIYTLFNQINARVLDDGFNIFIRLHHNCFFPLITLSELGLQIIIVFFGNEAFKVVEKGLTGNQWGICIGFSAITFVLSAIVKLIPLDKCIQSCLDKSSAKQLEEEKLSVKDEISIQSEITTDSKEKI